MLFKIATATIQQEIMASQHADQQGHVWNFEKKPEMMYFVARAVTANVPNGNADYFPLDELIKGYKTFVGRGLFLNHASNDVEKQRGKIIDALLVDQNPSDVYVKCLIEFNAEAYPELASMIRNNMLQDVSMGCQVSYSVCSNCGNKAPTMKQYCACIKNHKGSVLGMKQIYEINHGLDFIELSLVTRGADSTAKILEVIARKHGIDFEIALQKVASLEKPELLHISENSLEDIVMKSIQKANLQRGLNEAK